MSKQDRQGVRTPAGLEQKYSFGKVIAEQKMANARQDSELDSTNLTLQEFISFAASSIEKLQKDMTAANKSIQELSAKDEELEAKDKELEEIDSTLSSQIAKYWETIYPVGHIYLSLSSTSPATLFGGTWERIEDRFLLASGSIYGAGTTGGEATHTLTEDEMPKHQHGYNSYQNGYPSNHTDDSNYMTPVVKINAAHEGAGVNNTQSNYTGGSQPHNNMPPYLTVYAWQRTA